MLALPERQTQVMNRRMNRGVFFISFQFADSLSGCFVVPGKDNQRRSNGVCCGYGKFVTHRPQSRHVVTSSDRDGKLHTPVMIPREATSG
jgi:hypothetical protein